MEVDDGGANLRSNSAADADWLHIDELPRPFDTVCDDLTALGALSIEDFLSNTSSAGFDVAFHLQLPEILAAEKEKELEREKENEGKPTDDAVEEKPPAPKILKPVALLRQTGQAIFGSADRLNYEFLEEDGKKQCILTITHANGATRAYKSDSIFSRRADAKSQAAQIAVDMGAIDFIKSGDSDPNKGMLLNPLSVESGNMELDESAAKQIPKQPELDESLKKIEKCCVEWRAGRVKPHWVSFNDFKNKKEHGMALRISLNSHVCRVYAADPIHNTPWQAKLACADAAIKEGVIEFIQFGNGQTEPTKAVDNGVENLDVRSETPPPPTTGITLQDFFDTLPKPFPEEIGDKGPGNTPTWLNLTLQSARGARLASSFIPIIDNVRHLHGSILRIDRPGETRTYMVEAQFLKRHDAKCAVCLLAMSQGVGAYIRGLKEEAENKIPVHMRKLTEKVLQVLAAECGKVRQGNRLLFDFSSERDAFGCTLRVDISPDASQPNIREYVVNPEYRCKADAKAAVAFLAAEQGLVDSLRFNDAAPPADYVPFWEAQVNGSGDTYVPKRKGPDRDVDAEGRDRKKRKRGNSEQGDTSRSTPAPPKIKPEAHLPPKPTTETLAFSGYQPNARWKKPHANVSRGLVPTNAYVPAPRPMGQDRTGNRSGGPPPHLHRNHTASPPMPAYDSRAHTHPYDDRMGYRAGSAYPSNPTYTQPEPFPNNYPAYPPVPGQGHHYSNHVYHSPPPPPVVPPPPPPPPHQYPGYYGPPTPPHAPYGHYPYPPQYPPSYPATPYMAGYPPPVMYASPPPPPPSSIPPPYPPTSPPDQFTSRYDSRSQYPSRSPRSPPRPRSPPPPLPPPIRSPPRHSHHTSDYHHSYEAGWQVECNNRRRHSTAVEPRSRTNWETEPHYVKREPSPSPGGKRWQTNDQRTPPGQHPRPTHSVPTEPRHAGMKTERDSHAPNHISRQDNPKSNLDLLYEFCEQNKIPRPTFYHEDVQGKDGSKKYAVWAEKDAHRLEIQNHFSSIEEGYEKLSKRVLQWERSRLES
ncbi:hypothetical protein M413DRAFT_443298, partial [Hebeloma cylindrosporum]